MSNIDQQTLTALLNGKLAFKIYNETSSAWEVVKIHNPLLDAHAGATASSTEAGHVILNSELTSDVETQAATPKAIKTVFESVGSHVNDDASHILPVDKIKWDGYETKITELFQHSNDFKVGIAQIIGLTEVESDTVSAVKSGLELQKNALADKLTAAGKTVPPLATLKELIELV